MEPILARPFSGNQAQSKAPTSREEAAKQFEAHLVRQMVDVMFAGVFDGDASGNAGGMASIGQEGQKEHVVNELTTLLTSSGGLGLADAMLKQWSAKYGDEAGEQVSANVHQQPQIPALNKEDQ